MSADFFTTAGKSFKVYADRLSGSTAVTDCGRDTMSAATITILCKYFRDLGVPIRLRTDGGPQFTSREFEDFLVSLGVQHNVSSPHYHQSNGHAEAAVKQVKKLIAKIAPSGTIHEDLEHRNTPRSYGRSLQRWYLANHFDPVSPPTTHPLHQSGNQNERSVPFVQGSRKGP